MAISVVAYEKAAYTKDMKNACQSCLMPFSKDPGPRELELYCSLCFRNGKLCYEGNDLKEFQRKAYEGMIASGMNKFLAKFYTFCIRFAPRWKKK